MTGPATGWRMSLASEQPRLRLVGQRAYEPTPSKSCSWGRRDGGQRRASDGRGGMRVSLTWMPQTNCSFWRQT